VKHFEEESKSLSASIRMDTQISSGKDAAMINLLHRNQTLLMEMMQQQNMIFRGRPDERTDLSTPKKRFKIANELG